jgi:hypothetical protein
VMFTGSSVSGVTLANVQIANPGSHIVTLRSAGSAAFFGLQVEGSNAFDILDCNPAFRLTYSRSSPRLTASRRSPRNLSSSGPKIPLRSSGRCVPAAVPANT